MTFDWFRRRFDNEQEETPSAAADKTRTEPEQAEAEPSEAKAAEQAQDYLNYAKLAYENIRKRQLAAQQAAAQQAPESEAQVVSPLGKETTLASPPSAPAAEPAPEVAVPETPTPKTAVPETVAAETPTPETVEATVPETIAAETVTPETVAPVVEEPAAAEPAAETVTESVAEVAEPEPTTPLPFWAAAEAERRARLEQLRETAIVEPEPEPAPRPQETVPVAEEMAPELPDFTLDEGFLWSTEILAAQGRRADQISIEEITWLKRLRQGLGKTRRGLVNQLKAIVGQGPLNQDAVMEIEAALLQADVGVQATDAIIDALQKKLRSETLPPDAAITYLKQILREMLDAPLGDTASYAFAPEKDKLNIWLMTGVNGAGKTTTIGKLAHIAEKSGYKCLIAAADTFRAAAVEQVKVWGARSGVDVIANPGKNTDPAAVVFDAITAAQSRDVDLLLVDTAGRLQNKKNLMDELSKVRRIIDKKAPDAVVESLLVLDSTLGQNGLRQAEVFSEVAKLSGVVLTKLDGTAKGGIALAIVQQLGLPIRFIGAGEGIEDLRPFSSYEFVEALLNG
jgi:fused signal recognition particle receptor